PLPAGLELAGPPLPTDPRGPGISGRRVGDSGPGHRTDAAGPRDVHPWSERPDVPLLPLRHGPLRAGRVHGDHRLRAAIGLGAGGRGVGAVRARRRCPLGRLGQEGQRNERLRGLTPRSNHSTSARRMSEAPISSSTRWLRSAKETRSPGSDVAMYESVPDSAENTPCTSGPAGSAASSGSMRLARSKRNAPAAAPSRTARPAFERRIRPREKPTTSASNTTARTPVKTSQVV